MDSLFVQSRLDAAPTPRDVDAAVRAMVLMGGLPRYIAVSAWPKVVLSNGKHRLEILVAPDYASLGDDSSVYRLSRMTQYGAQELADSLDSILPSKKIVYAVENASSPKIPFIDVKEHGVPLADIETPRAADLASSLAQDAYDSRGISNGSALTYGYKKSIVVGPGLDGSRVAIYGGRWPGWTSVVQPYGTPHSSDYSDYSHGVMLVSKKAFLDGELVDLRRDVFGSTDPSVYGLVSDQGRFDPVFPNAGSRSRAEFGPSSGGGGGSSGGGGGVVGPTSSSKTPSLDSPPSPSSPSSPARRVAGVGLLLAGLYFAYRWIL